MSSFIIHFWRVFYFSKMKYSLQPLSSSLEPASNCASKPFHHYLASFYLRKIHEHQQSNLWTLFLNRSFFHPVFAKSSLQVTNIENSALTSDIRWIEFKLRLTSIESKSNQFKFNGYSKVNLNWFIVVLKIWNEIIDNWQTLNYFFWLIQRIVGFLLACCHCTNDYTFHTFPFSVVPSFWNFSFFFLFYLSVFMHSPIHWNVRLQQKYKKLRRRQVTWLSLIFKSE